MTAVAHAAPGPADPDTVSRTPDDPDLQLARDPRAGAGRLMVLAGNRPDLRGVIADNPGCSPELRAWVSRMGGASAGSGRRGPEAAAARTDGSGGADDPDDAVSLAPTGWEPSDIGLGDEPFGSVLGDPLMGSPLFDDDGSRHEPTDADPTEPSGAAARNDKGGRRAPSSRRTARPHTASAHTASARTASRTAAARVTQAPA
ncbi:variant leucine-rich repeat-containing protein, partial [Actinomyces oris]